MKRIHIVNPTAGQGNANEICARYRKDGDIVYETKYAGDVADSAERFCREYAGEEIQLCVYGGDGSLSEAANGILRAGANEYAVLTPVPCGTGNDFVRMFPEGDRAERLVDIIRVGDKYAVNMLNAGFDADVAAMISELKKKPLLGGSMAYIAGVVKRLCQPMGRRMKITWVDEAGAAHETEDDILLCAIGNACYCGGGFRAAPAASMTDGLLDLLIVTRVSRLKFISLVGRYHDGTHIGADGAPVPAFASCMRYLRCSSMTISGMKQFSRDGEISTDAEVSVSVIPSALRCIPCAALL